MAEHDERLQTPILDSLITFTTGVILGATGVLALREWDGQMQSMTYVPWLFGLCGLLGVLQLSHWAMRRR